MKKRCWFLLLLGIFFLALSLALPFRDISLAAEQGNSIIGGAGFPTYAFVLQHKYLWLTILSTVVAAIGLAGILRPVFGRRK